MERSILPIYTYKYIYIYTHTHIYKHVYNIFKYIKHIYI